MILGIWSDIHLRDTSPVNRIDDYYVKQFSKMEQCVQIFKQHKCDYIIHAGDLFDAYRVSFRLLWDTIEFFRKHNLKIFSIIGNHDIQGYNIDTLNNSALGIMFQIGYVKHINDIIGSIKIHGIDTRTKYNIDDYTNDYDIIVSHDMILPTADAPFDHVYYKTLDGKCRCIISGHYHKPFILHGHKTLFLNPGSIMRMTVDDNFIGGVDILDTNGYNVKRVELDIEPFEKVFYRPSHADDKQRGDVMINNLQVIGKDHMIDRIIHYAKQNQYTDAVIDNVVSYIKQAQESIGV